MADKRFLERLGAEIERRAQLPAQERWDALVRRGAIDAKGKVLLRGPEAFGAEACASAPRKGRGK